LGGGFELALAADIRIFSESAKVGLREVAIGIIPGAGGTQRLPRIIGYSKSVYWITSAHIFTASEAYQDGIANFLVPDAMLKQKAIDVASEISENAPLAVQQAKKSIQASYDFNQAEGLYQEFEHYKNIIRTKDRMEGLKAFKEKRSPKYQGE
jgi:enoyl-CoA hydratase/carnithine racemase